MSRQGRRPDRRCLLETLSVGPSLDGCARPAAVPLDTRPETWFRPARRPFSARSGRPASAQSRPGSPVAGLRTLPSRRRTAFGPYRAVMARRREISCGLGAAGGLRDYYLVQIRLILHGLARISTRTALVGMPVLPSRVGEWDRFAFRRRVGNTAVVCRDYGSASVAVGISRDQ